MNELSKNGAARNITEFSIETVKNEQLRVTDARHRNVFVREKLAKKSSTQFLEFNFIHVLFWFLPVPTRSTRWKCEIGFPTFICWNVNFRRNSSLFLFIRMQNVFALDKNSRFYFKQAAKTLWSLFHHRSWNKWCSILLFTGKWAIFFKKYVEHFSLWIMACGCLCL